MAISLRRLARLRSYLVRVLVAAERLGAEELAVAVHADEVARRLRRGRRGVEEGELKVELLLHYTRSV